MKRSYELTIRDARDVKVHESTFICRFERTAFELGAKLLAEHQGFIASLQYDVRGSRHSKYLLRGKWRNDFHHQNALAKLSLPPASATKIRSKMNAAVAYVWTLADACPDLPAEHLRGWLCMITDGTSVLTPPCFDNQNLLEEFVRTIFTLATPEPPHDPAPVVVDTAPFIAADVDGVADEPDDDDELATVANEGRPGSRGWRRSRDRCPGLFATPALKLVDTVVDDDDELATVADDGPGLFSAPALKLIDTAPVAEMAAEPATMLIRDMIAHLTAHGYRVTKKAAKAEAGIPPGLAFERAMTNAKYAAIAELGPHWYLVEGASQYFTLPQRLANYRFTRADGMKSIVIKNRRDQRGPVARFWAEGQIPDCVILTPDGPRETADYEHYDDDERIAA